MSPRALHVTARNRTEPPFFRHSGGCRRRRAGIALQSLQLAVVSVVQAEQRTEGGPGQVQAGTLWGHPTHTALTAGPLLMRARRKGGVRSLASKVYTPCLWEKHPHAHISPHTPHARARHTLSFRVSSPHSVDLHYPQAVGCVFSAQSTSPASGGGGGAGKQKRWVCGEKVKNARVVSPGEGYWLWYTYTKFICTRRGLVECVGPSGVPWLRWWCRSCEFPCVVVGCFVVVGAVCCHREGVHGAAGLGSGLCGCGRQGRRHGSVRVPCWHRWGLRCCIMSLATRVFLTCCGVCTCVEV